MLLYGLSDVGLIGCIWCNWHYYYLTEKSQLLFQNFWSSSEMVWFISYTMFSESCLGENLSKDLVLRFGVPQVSVPGPVLFAFLKPIGKIWSEHMLFSFFYMLFYCYAEDNYIYLVIKLSDISDDLKYRFETCLTSVRSLMCTNLLIRINGMNCFYA